jgi:hypothetical protein
MVKMIMLLKRRPGMSMAEFIDYYETHHRLLGEKYLKGHAIRYVRRYLTPLPDPATGQVPEADHDAVLEMWYPDQAACDAAMAAITAPAAQAELAADEAKLFDRPKLRAFMVQEFDSDMASG